MTTALQVITQALGLLGIKSAGQNVEAEDAQDCLGFLNGMIDSWRNESLFAYTKQRVTATLGAGAQTATIGPTGDFIISPRPIRLDAGSFFSSGDLDYPIESIGADEYNAITLKAQGSLGPVVVYLDTAFPTGTLYFFPQGASSVDVTLMCLVQMAEFADVNTDYELAPGQKRALSYSLAEEVGPIFGAKVPPAVSKVASSARRSLKRANHRTPQLDMRPTNYAPYVFIGSGDDGVADGGTP